MLIRPGEVAPPFELVASDGTRVRLADLLQQHMVLLLFYPGNDTPG
jgi:peroxiredoxin